MSKVGPSLSNERARKGALGGNRPWSPKNFARAKNFGQFINLFQPWNIIANPMPPKLPKLQVS